MIIFLTVLGVMLLSLMLKKTKKPVEDSWSGNLDYRCSSHYIWDKPMNDGRTDRNSHYNEGNAYKVDEYKY